MRDVETLTNSNSALLVTATSAVPQLAAMLSCDLSCLAAAEGLAHIGFPAATEAKPQLDAIAKSTPRDCKVWVSGNGWETTFTEGSYDLHAYTSHGARDDQAKKIRVHGDGCSSIVYDDPSLNNYLSKFEYDGGHTHGLPGGISSIAVRRLKGDCIYHAQRTLYNIGARSNMPSFTKAPNKPRVKTQCRCSFRCNYNPRHYGGTTQIRANQNYDCVENSFKKFYKECRWGIHTAWSCKWQ
jgi:hypothetical protein